MQYGVKYSISGSEVVSPISTREMAIAIASSWAKTLYPDARPVYKLSNDWHELKDSEISVNDLPTKEG
jgi:hypothetical protein